MGLDAVSGNEVPDAAGSVVPPPGRLPEWERSVLAEAAAAALRPLARATRPHDPATPALVAVLRDEVRRLPRWLAHYRGLGVTRFAIVDHGSKDGTAARLAAEPDVDLYAVDRPFWGKHGWISALIARMGYGRWYLHVDADERLVFDGAAEDGRPGRGLADLVALAEARGLRRLRGMLVDLYPPGPLCRPEDAAEAAAGVPGERRGEMLFDAAGYDEALCLERVSRKGGPRRRVLGLEVELTKYPLFRLDPGELASSPHHLYPYPENWRSDCLAGLLHDKFGPGFRAHAARAAAEGNYWRESLEYRTTLAALARDPGLSLAGPVSRRYRRAADLVAAGLIAPIRWPARAGSPAGSSARASSGTPSALLARAAGWGWVWG